MIFLDTSILLYSISRAPDEARKRNLAIDLLDRDACALSLQVLQEFYVQATRPGRGDALPHEIAVALMRTWLRFPVQANDLAVMADALDIRADLGFSYWDSAIVAAARALGCTELMTEDLQHGQAVGALRIVDPFRV